MFDYENLVKSAQRANLKFYDHVREHRLPEDVYWNN